MRENPGFPSVYFIQKRPRAAGSQGSGRQQMLPSSGDGRGATTTNYLRQYTGWKQLMLKIKQGRERMAILLQRPGRFPRERP